ncbi:hypothetical protein BOTNAR_0193g00300 [Botryotinia narcissicola]|uniref:Single-strand DNA deaminase toxin A-like C-terminal domain-containing protein n=1 Tax=Botryotinia narcissicola TaxID=278944 RepID=A0A4Z1I989_9HELO|nr:hypothetical protein BOTNAR_0193g00300 [Botryotinia narcissicola]
MTEALRLSELGSARPKQPYELRMEVAALRKLRKAEEEAKSRQSQAKSGNIPVVQELNSNEADETLVRDEPATQSHENNGAKSTNDSKDTSNGIGDLIEAVSETTLETPVIKKTPKGIWNELTNNADPKLASYRSLDITPDPSWLESILSKVNNILEKTADRGQLKGDDKGPAIEHRNDVLKILMQGALELGSHILDSPEIARKLAAQHGIQNEDLRNAVPSVGAGTNNIADENTVIASTRCENCSGALAPYPEVEGLEVPTQDPRDRLPFFEYIPQASSSLYYTIDLFERIYSLPLKKYKESSGEKTVARLYVPKTTPRPNTPKLQIINSISGWDDRLPETTHPSAFISNGIWTRRVQTLCYATKYQLESCGDKDRGIEGRYNSCHAEKQVLAYWLYTYVLSSRRSDPSVRWDKKFNEPIKPEYYEGLFIVVSTPLCDCCDRFLNHVATYYQISFTIKSPDEVIEFPKLPLKARRDD